MEDNEVFFFQDADLSENFKNNLMVPLHLMNFFTRKKSNVVFFKGLMK